MTRKNRAVIIDLDDTLIDTMSLYSQAVDAFTELMVRMGVEAQETRRELDRIDTENVEQLGFTRERFPTSMVQTYEFLCARHGMVPTDAVRNQCWTIGNSVFAQTPRLMYGVTATLSALKDYYRLILLTKGDQSVQESRLDQTNLRPFFDAVYIVPDKNETQLDLVIQREGIDPAFTWVVGDSPRSDINPALKTGLRCVWIPRDTWDVEYEEIDSSDVVVLDSFHQLSEYLMYLAA